MKKMDILINQSIIRQEHIITFQAIYQHPGINIEINKIE